MYISGGDVEIPTKNGADVKIKSAIVDDYNKYIEEVDFMDFLIFIIMLF